MQEKDHRQKDFDERPDKTVPSMTREQRRTKERIEKEARTQLDKFLNSFYEFFNENDPDSETVAQKRKELNAKWKMYCHARRLLPAALTALDTQIQVIVDSYKKELADL